MTGKTVAPPITESTSAKEFRFNDESGTAGHAIVFGEALRPRLRIRRGDEGDYAIPMP